MYYDVTLDDYPKLKSDCSDSERINRAIGDCCDGVVFIPKGNYSIADPIFINNRCSVLLHPAAVLIAVKPMDFMITVDCEYGESTHDFMGEAEKINLSLTRFFEGGVLNAMGLCSCLKIVHYRRFSLSKTVLLNGKEYGLYAGGYYELICNNICCKCSINGLSGNIGIYSNNGDSHYTDCGVVDYTTGIAMMGGGSNRLTRCHVWGGPVKPLPNEDVPEMLKDSVSFRISSDDTILRDCYADTAKIGFLIEKDTRLLGCSYFNNDYFELDDITAVVQTGGRLLVSESTFIKSAPHNTLYENKGGTSVWKNNVFKDGFEEI